MTIEERKNNFIKKAKEIHGEIYDYSKVDYINSGTKVTVVCPKHGEFLISPTLHISPRDKCGCHKCKIENYIPSEKLDNDKEKFIEESNIVHNKKYDYSKVEYKGTNKKVAIVCPIHGEFSQLPKVHRKGQGCPKCDKSYKLDTKSFIRKAVERHGNTYDYSLVNYKLSTDKVTIICKEHGSFSIKASSHLMGQGCPVCSKRKRYSYEEIVDRFRKIHGEKYDYSLVDFKSMHTKVKIICREHGIFEQSPNDHAKGCGCPNCGEFCRIAKKIIPFSRVLKQFREVHGDRYNYREDTYISKKHKMTMICPIHGDFEQSVNNHLQGKGCPQCSISKLEQRVKIILESMNIDFIYQFRFSDDANMRKTPYDFGIMKDNQVIALIECQGIQHYEAVKYFGGEKQLLKQREIDKFKKDYCNKKLLTLLEIPYWYTKTEIEKNLKDFLTI